MPTCAREPLQSATGKQCAECGKMSAHSAKFCNKCGNRLFASTPFYLKNGRGDCHVKESFEVSVKRPAARPVMATAKTTATPGVTATAFAHARVIEPHTYPPQLKVLGIVVGLAVIFSMFSMPQDLAATKAIMHGIFDFRDGRFEKASEDYRQAVILSPTSRDAKIGAAKSLLSTRNQADMRHALIYLVGLELSKCDMTELDPLLPEKYKKLFSTDAKDNTTLVATQIPDDRPTELIGAR